MVTHGLLLVEIGNQWLGSLARMRFGVKRPIIFYEASSTSFSFLTRTLRWPVERSGQETPSSVMSGIVRLAYGFHIRGIGSGSAAGV